MKEYLPEQIRNIAVIGHGGSGKTILSDAILLNSGGATRIGSIEDGTTISDYRPDEIDRQISINSTLISTEFNDTKVNVIDTPGFTDFAGDVISSLHVADTALLLLKAVEGVEVGSELFWKYAESNNSPVILAISKMDNEHADFDTVLGQAQDRFGSNVAVVEFPVKQGTGFNAVIDVIKKKMLTFSPDGSYKEEDVPGDLQGKTDELHEALVEKVAESTEDLMNSFFEHGELSAEELTSGLHHAIRSRTIFPMFCISGQQNVGVRSMLEFFIDYAPSPTDLKTFKAMKGGEETQVDVAKDGDPVLFIFKTLSEQHVGELSMFRVYSGTLSAGQDLLNVQSGKTERINQFFAMKGKERKEVTKMYPGDIGAVVKLKDTHTNNTLCGKGNPLAVPTIPFPDPVITGAIKPKSKGDEDKISQGLHTMHEEDPAFMVKVDSETHQTIVLGQGEIHLDVMMKRLKQRFGVEVDLVQPRIPYRESLKKPADVSYKHKKQTGGAGQYAEVYLKVEPQERGAGYEFVDAIVGGVISGRYVPAVDKGIQESMAKGVIAGYPMVDLKVTLYDGSQHTVDSNEMAFKMAAQQALKKAVEISVPSLLEPLYQVEIIVPDEFMGDVMGDISSRRGKIQGMDAEGPFQVIRAMVPLSELYQYATRLRSITQGRGMYRRSFSHYEEVPHEVMLKIIEESKKAKEEES